MNLLQSLTILHEASISLDKLPDDVISEIKRNITAGAKDLDQKWYNALHIVQQAYKVSGTQRPTPDMKAAWIDYESMLQYAVTQLAKYRGMDGDWRMSSAIFREAMEKVHTFRVTEMGSNHNTTHVIEATNITEVIDTIEDETARQFDVSISQSTDPENPNAAIMSFSKWGIRKNYRVKVQQL